MLYLEKLETHIKDLHKDYHTVLKDNYAQFVEEKKESGLSEEEIERLLAAPERIADKYAMYAMLNRLVGQRKTTGAPRAVRESLAKGYIDRTYYRSQRALYVAKSAVCVTVGLFLIIIGILFYIAGMDNERARMAVVFAVSMVLVSFGIFLAYKVTDFRFTFISRMLEAAIASCDLKDFSFVPRPRNSES